MLRQRMWLDARCALHTGMKTCRSFSVVRRVDARRKENSQIEKRQILDDIRRPVGFVIDLFETLLDHRKQSENEPRPQFGYGPHDKDFGERSQVDSSKNCCFGFLHRHPSHDKFIYDPNMRTLLVDKFFYTTPRIEAALINHEDISVKPEILRVYTDASSLGGYVATAAVVPAFNLIRTRVLGNNLKGSEDPVRLLPHPYWNAVGKPPYAWSVPAAELYAMVDGVTLAATLARPQQEVYLFSDSFKNLNPSFWGGGIIYSQIEQVLGYLKKLRTVLESKGISVILHYLPSSNKSKDHALANDAAHDASQPVEHFAELGRLRYERGLQEDLEDIEETRYPRAYREVMYKMYCLRKWQGGNWIDDEADRNLYNRTLSELRDERRQILQEMLPEHRRTRVAFDSSPRSVALIKAEWLFRQWGEDSGWKAWHARFDNERLSSIPIPADLKPPYPQPHTDMTIESFQEKMRKYPHYFDAKDFKTRVKKHERNSTEMWLCRSLGRSLYQISNYLD